MDASEKNSELERNNASAGESTDALPQSSARRANSGKSQSKPRLKLFKKVMEKSVQWLVESANFDRFSHYLEPLSKQNPSLTESLHKRFIHQLQTLVKSEIDCMIEEGDLEAKFEELDKLEEHAKDASQPAWRPSGVPEKDVCSELVSNYRKQEEYMRLQLKKIQKENAALAERVQAGREKVTLTEQQITSAVNEWGGSLEDLEAYVLTVSKPENCI